MKGERLRKISERGTEKEMIDEVQSVVGNDQVRGSCEKILLFLFSFFRHILFPFNYLLIIKENFYSTHL